MTVVAALRSIAAFVSHFFPVATTESLALLFGCPAPVVRFGVVDQRFVFPTRFDGSIRAGIRHSSRVM